MSDDRITAPPPNRRRTYRGECLVARRAERRSKLLDAALECFGTAGYHATSVRGICQAAGLTERYFYESFEHSEALLEALYVKLSDDLETRILSAVEGASPDPVAMSHAALDVYYRHCEDERVARVTHFEILGVSPAIDHCYRTCTGRFAQLIARVMHAIAPAAQRPPQQMELVSAGMVGAVVQITMHWVLSGYRASRSEVVESAQLLFSAVVGHWQRSPNTGT
ncbi:MAG: TetR/AcrR family transcriptional regulator [Polycyclovorans sp.]|nr:TetR/AcrR family transcriptional regulator [Gammaproteobacteria bacterium]MDP1541640.1 TetR/AcrR family transcriptional regulator [Polycyclovorans sp.]MEC8850279.1 TetR/AcrR family transcriptional regulator [Pseudomonadota bacterium]|tara:strand:- start:20327 stop:20998 length:672 start_codon:yes stop_codon:yes gene_type:complete